MLALDPSTVALGFSFGGVNDGAPRGGTYELPGAADHVFDRTLARATETVDGLIRLTNAERVCIEAPILVNDSQHAARTTMHLIQLAGAIRAVVARAQIPCTLVAVSTVRKHFIGQGCLPSAQAKAAVMRRCDQLGWSYKDDDQADANAVWCWGMSKFYPAWVPNGTPLFSRSA